MTAADAEAAAEELFERRFGAQQRAYEREQARKLKAKSKSKSKVKMMTKAEKRAHKLAKKARLAARREAKAEARRLSFAVGSIERYEEDAFKDTRERLRVGASKYFEQEEDVAKSEQDFLNTFKTIKARYLYNTPHVYTEDEQWIEDHPYAEI